MRVAILCALYYCATTFSVAKAEVRHIQPIKDQIVVVKTSLGIGTIIQVPDRPSSVVIGDQSSFLVEYLDKAITIKPLTPNATTNLYIYTDWQRYNVKLVPIQRDRADYVVYLELKPAKKKTSSISWKNFHNFLKNEDTRIDTDRIGTNHSDLNLIEFKITPSKNLNFKPEWIWLTQKGNTIPIHKLYLEDLSMKANKKVSGLILVRKTDLNGKLPIQFELRRKRLSYLTIKEPDKW